METAQSPVAASEADIEFKQNAETLQKLIGAALQDSEMIQPIDHSGLGVDFFRKELFRRSDKIWSAAASELSELNRIGDALKTAEASLRRNIPRDPLFLRLLEWFTQAAIVALVVGGVSAAIFTYLRGIMWLPTQLSLHRLSVFSSLITIAILGIARNMLRTVAWVQHSNYLANSETAAEVRRLHGEQKSTVAAIENLLLEKGIKAELRLIINAQIDPDYSVNLGPKTSPGLAEVFDPVYEVPTEARDRLLSTLENIPGGSIGVAGPRGAGKSTLIWSLCRGAIGKLGERPLYALVTSAPVKYDGREFILHLFSSLCYKVLGRGVADDPFPIPSTELANPEARFLTLRILKRVSPVLIVLGTSLIALGSFVAIQLAPSLKATAGTKSQEHVDASSAANQNTPGASPFTSFLKAADVKPGTLIMWGMISAIVGASVLTLRLPSVRRASREQVTAARQSSVDNATKRVGRAIAEMASRMLHEIRFQQSYSAGWSGSLKLPVGIEETVNQALELADRQRTFPEIVELYRVFVRMITEKNAVLIGIDELDKLASDEMAQQFLNEIKSIFNLDHCYYLISVSESAISSFERRGLPFRDAFDSALDTIIYVDYLTLENAKQLLMRRVIGLQAPFMSLCYCISGGLARDLIRNCRDVLELGRKCLQSDLSTICGLLVLTDVKAKLRAIEASVRSSLIEPYASKLITGVRALELSTSSASHFLAARLQFNQHELLHPDVRTDSDPSRAQFQSLALELHVYLYFAATLLEFFSNDLSKERLIRAEKSGGIATLARVRQTFSVNAKVALALLNDCRKSVNLRVE